MSAERILVVYRPGRRGRAQLREAAQAHSAAVIRVVRILDTRSGFDTDGPAGQLPGERIARGAAAERQALEAAVHGAGIHACGIDVLWGEPPTVFAALVASWCPDRVLGGNRWTSRFSGKPDRATWLGTLLRRMTGSIPTATAATGPADCEPAP